MGTGCLEVQIQAMSTSDLEIGILMTILPCMGIIGSVIGLVGWCQNTVTGSDCKFDLKLYLSVVALMIFQPDPSVSKDVLSFKSQSCHTSDLVW